ERNQRDLARLPRLEPHRRPGRDVEPHAARLLAIELQRRIGLEEMIVRADLDRPVAGVGDGERRGLAAGVERDLAGLDEELAGGHGVSFQRIGSCTVTSFVPSGNVASTWISGIISAMPSITWARVITWAPACIRSATLLPSRAPSRMKSEISATASGWLSLTPRSSRRRATMAAMAIKSLSFSRGVRCMCASINPKFRQWPGVERGEHGREVAPQQRAVAGAEPRDRDAVPARDADLAGKRAGPHGRDLAVVTRHAQHGRARAAAPCRCRLGKPAG